MRNRAVKSLDRPSLAGRQAILVPIGAALLCASILLPFTESVGQIKLRPFDILLVGFVLVLALTRFAAFGSASCRAGAISVGFLGAYSIRGLNAFYLGDYIYGVKELLQAGEFLALGAAIAVATADAGSRRLFMRVLLAATFVIAIAAFIYYTVTFGWGGTVKKLNAPKYSYGLATVLAALGLACGYWRNRRVQLCLWPAIGLLIFVGERSAWLGCGVAVGGCCLARYRMSLAQAMRQWIVPCIGAASLTAVIVFAASHTSNYVSNQLFRLVEPLTLVDLSSGRIDYLGASSPSNQSRLFQLDTVLRIVSEAPFSGVGTGRYMEYAFRSGSSGLWATDDIHGQYWMLLAENGLFALLLYSLVWAVIYGRAYKASKIAHQELRASALMVLGLAVYGGFTSFFTSGSAVNLMILFLPVGLLAGIELEVGRLRCAHAQQAFSTRLATSLSRPKSRNTVVGQR